MQLCQDNDVELSNFRIGRSLEIHEIALKLLTTLLLANAMSFDVVVWAVVALLPWQVPCEDV